MLLQSTVNSARYIAKVISMLLSFQRQEGDVVFQQDNAKYRPNSSNLRLHHLEGHDLKFAVTFGVSAE